MDGRTARGRRLRTLWAAVWICAGQVVFVVDMLAALREAWYLDSTLV